MDDDAASGRRSGGWPRREPSPILRRTWPLWLVCGIGLIAYSVASGNPSMRLGAPLRIGIPLFVVGAAGGYAVLRWDRRHR